MRNKTHKLSLKILVLIGAITMSLSLASCACTSTAQAQQEEMFVRVASQGDFDVIKHKDTGVLYLLVDGYKDFEITPLLNQDGTPRTSMTIDDWND